MACFSPGVLGLFLLVLLFCEGAVFAYTLVDGVDCDMMGKEELTFTHAQCIELQVDADGYAVLDTGELVYVSENGEVFAVLEDPEEWPYGPVDEYAGQHREDFDGDDCYTEVTQGDIDIECEEVDPVVEYAEQPATKGGPDLEGEVVMHMVDSSDEYGVQVTLIGPVTEDVTTTTKEGLDIEYVNFTMDPDVEYAEQLATKGGPGHGR